MADTARHRLAHDAASAGSPSPPRLFLLWSAAIEARLVYLQVFQHAELAARAERQQSRTIEAPAKRGEIARSPRPRARLQRRRRHRSTPFRPRSPTRPRPPPALCGALGDCAREGSPGARSSASAAAAHFVYVRRQVSPEQARRVAALELDGVGFIEGEPPLLPEQGARRAPARLRRHRQRRPAAASRRPTTR